MIGKSLIVAARFRGEASRRAISVPNRARQERRARISNQKEHGDHGGSRGAPARIKWRNV